MATEINSNRIAISASLTLPETSGREAALSHPEPTVTGSETRGEEATAGGKKTTSIVTESANAERNIDAKELEKQVQELQQAATLKSWNINFTLDKDDGRTVIRVVDTETQETIRQIPSEEWLNISKKLKELVGGDDHSPSTLPGMLFEEQI